MDELVAAFFAKRTLQDNLDYCARKGLTVGAIADAAELIDHEYIKGRAFAPKDEDWERAVEYWSSFKSDPECTFDKEITINLDVLTSMVTWGTNPGQAVEIDGSVPELSSFSDSEKTSAEKALEYIALQPGANFNRVAKVAC